MGAGFFGKLPASGDFVARGLPPGLQPVLDRWLTRLLLASGRSFEDWPEDGFCGLIEHGGERLAVLVLPSQDASGRQFPLAAVTPAHGADKDGIDIWAGQLRPVLLRATRAGLDAAGLIGELRMMPELTGPGGGDLVPPLIWGGAIPPEDPLTLISRLADCPPVGREG